MKELTFKDLGVVFKGKKKKLLDVGCATGDFVKLMSDLGFDAEGIDISEELVGLAVKRKLKCSLNNVENINKKYDCISLWHVIEHVRYPRELLAKVRTLLRKDGDLFIETPCYGLIAEAFGDGWRFFMPPEHICIFTQHSLLKFLCDMGFVIKNWVRFGSGNDTGKMPAPNKNAMDCIAKTLQIGDTIAVWAKKER
jgi:2-polyprenyl-3-methyl-5-hydroxy-6-metoxy-1,4-benzoquinol methylase